MKFSLSAHYHKPEAQAVLKVIRDWLLKKGHEVVAREDRPNFEITLGGDGNAMRTVAACSKLNIPTLAINAGNLGFLTSGNISNWQARLELLLAGEYYIEETLSLELDLGGSKLGPFANDIYFRCTTGITTFSYWVDNDLVYKDLPADGIIVATPSGSTGYNQGAGGPICQPGADSFIVTPICPTYVNALPLIVNKEAVIRIEVGECRDPNKVYLFADGEEMTKSYGRDIITIKKDLTKILFVRFNGKDFYEALRTKKGLMA